MNESTLAVNEIHEGDCLEVMRDIPDGSIDMILCDMPYGTTACKWDTVIPFEPLWEQYERIIKDNGAMVFTASQPFTSALIMSNLKKFRYELIWEKTIATNPFSSHKQPMKKHENICIFYKKQPIYNPQFEKGKPYTDRGNRKNKRSAQREMNKTAIINNGYRYPSSVKIFSNGNKNSLHPTQKPVPLFEYLIKTYTNENEIVLDNCIGSGTTAVAAINTNRNFIGIEQDAGYAAIARQRVNDAIAAKEDN